MRLTLRADWMSLKAFPAQEVPKFLLLTGLNGAGKSQFLAAIKSGVLSDEAAPRPATGDAIPLFLSGGFAIKESNTPERSDALFALDDAANFVEVAFRPFRTAWLRWGEEQGFSRAQLIELTKSLANKIDLPGGLGPLNALSGLLQDWRQSAADIAVPAQFRERISKANSELKLPFYLLERADIQKAALNPVPFFSSSVQAVFNRYRDRHVRNALAKLQRESGHAGAEFLDTEAFERAYGPPPWEVLNETLEKLGIIARFAIPSMTDFREAKAMMSIPGGTVIPYKSLSSGERIIVNLALCGYQQDNVSEKIVAPSMVLLDEVDAPLHPAMIKTYLSVITDVLIGRFGMSVIATTHSPTTVALFPGDLVGVLQNGVPGIEMASKQDALDRLTTGVPTLSISADGRRQVFVESPIDVELYEHLYSLTKRRLASERTLQFISTGTKERNSGGDIVRRIVRSLVDAGSLTTWGLVDWDGKATRDGKIVVLAEGRRNGIENLILDPLAIALAVYHDFPQQVRQLGLPENLTYLQAAGLDEGRLQPIVSRITEIVFGHRPMDTVQVVYLGHQTLQIDRRWLEADDHLLEERLFTSMPFLNERAKSRGAGQLMKYILTNILSDVPAALPSEVLVTFSALLE